MREMESSRESTGTSDVWPTQYNSISSKRGHLRSVNRRSNKPLPCRSNVNGYNRLQTLKLKASMLSRSLLCS